MTPSTDTYTTSVALSSPFDDAWDRLTDPFRFPSLFPNWITTIDANGGGGGPYSVTGPDDEEFELAVASVRGSGVLDFEVDRRNTRRGRLVRAGDGSAFVCVVVRGEEEGSGEWETRKRKLDVDLAAARRMIDADAGVPADVDGGEVGF